MKLTLIFYHKIKRMAASRGIIITLESEPKNPYFQVGNLAPWGNTNTWPDIGHHHHVTSHVTSVSTCNAPVARIHSIAVQLPATIWKTVHGPGNKRQRYRAKDKERKALCVLGTVGSGVVVKDTRAGVNSSLGSNPSRILKRGELRQGTYPRDHLLSYKVRTLAVPHLRGRSPELSNLMFVKCLEQGIVFDLYAHHTIIPFVKGMSHFNKTEKEGMFVNRVHKQSTQS